MKTFEQLWRQLVRKKPGLEVASATVSFRSDNLKKLLHQVYKQGQKSVPSRESGDPLGGIFGDIFGEP